MKIYRLSAEANNYQNIVPVDDNDWHVFNRQFDGSSLKNDWVSPLVEVLRDKHQNINLPASDFPSLASHIPVFSMRAVSVLRPLIEPYGEFLKLDMKEQELYAFNVTKLVDALDIKKSNIQTFSDGKRIMWIRKHVFNQSIIGNIPIFKLPQTPTMYVYVNDIFVSSVISCHLTGFQFLED